MSEITQATHALLAAQSRMLDDWSEYPPGSADRLALWTDLHRSADVLREALEHQAA